MSNNYQVLLEEAVSGAEVLEVINKREKDSELTYRETRIQEHLNKFNKLSLKEFKEGVKELNQLEIPRLEESHMIKILELLPKNGTELRAITSHSGVVLVDDNVKAILDVVKKFA